MTIKDDALSPFFIIADYHGFSLWENDGKKEIKHIDKDPDLNRVVMEVVRRKLSAMSDVVSLAEYNRRGEAMLAMVRQASGEQERKRPDMVGERETIS